MLLYCSYCISVLPACGSAQASSCYFSYTYQRCVDVTRLTQLVSSPEQTKGAAQYTIAHFYLLHLCTLSASCALFVTMSLCWSIYSTSIACNGGVSQSVRHQPQRTCCTVSFSNIIATTATTTTGNDIAAEENDAIALHCRI